MSNNQGYTLKQASEALGVSQITVRRLIKSGKVKARLVPAKFGNAYVIDELPPALVKKPLPDTPLSVPALINRLEQLSQEVGYWRAKAESAEQRLLLLESPKQAPKQRWWQRLFRT